MPRQTKKQKFQNESGEALKSLLNDQVEARLKREISISHGQPVPALNKGEKSAASEESEVPSSRHAVPGSDPELRKMPGQRETKVQLTSRIEKLLRELALLEHEYLNIQSELDESRQIHKNYEQKIELLEKEKQDLEQELESKDMLISRQQKREEELNGQVQGLGLEKEELSRKLREYESDLEIRIQANTRLSSALDAGKAEQARLKSDLDVMKQKMDNLNEQNRQLKGKIKEMEMMQSHEQTEQKASRDMMSAEDWRKKADRLWDGVRYTAPQKAIEFLSIGLKLEPERAQLHNDRGLANLDDYRIKESIDDFTAAIALKPDFAEAYHNRAVVLLRDGKKFAAKKDFQMAARLGLWMGLNYLRSPGASPGLFSKILIALGIKKGKMR